MSKLIRELVNEIQQKNNIPSARQVALSVDIEDYHLNKMMKNDGKPNALNYLKLAKKAGWDLDKALSKIEGGYSSLSLIFVIAVLSALCFLGITQPSAKLSSLTLLSSEQCILCKIRRWFKKHIERLTFPVFA